MCECGERGLLLVVLFAQNIIFVSVAAGASLVALGGWPWCLGCVCLFEGSLRLLSRELKITLKVRLRLLLTKLKITLKGV